MDPGSADNAVWSSAIVIKTAGSGPPIRPTAMQQKTRSISALDDLGSALIPGHHRCGDSPLWQGRLSIPFFESPSMWYKFGLAKILLRSGKVVGTAAAVLLFYQLILVARLKVILRTRSSTSRPGGPHPSTQRHCHLAAGLFTPRPRSDIG